MSEELRRIVGIQPPTIEIFEVYQVSQEFYREVQAREELKEYCDWYYETARQNRQELETLRKDINMMGWFTRKSWKNQ